MVAASRTLQRVRKALHCRCGKVLEYAKKSGGDFPWGFAHCGQIPTSNGVYDCACAQVRMAFFVRIRHPCS